MSQEMILFLTIDHPKMFYLFQDDYNLIPFLFVQNLFDFVSHGNYTTQTHAVIMFLMISNTVNELMNIMQKLSTLKFNLVYVDTEERMYIIEINYKFWKYYCYLSITESCYSYLTHHFSFSNRNVTIRWPGSIE